MTEPTPIRPPEEPELLALRPPPPPPNPYWAPFVLARLPKPPQNR